MMQTEDGARVCLLRTFASGGDHAALQASDRERSLAMAPALLVQADVFHVADGLAEWSGT